MAVVTAACVQMRSGKDPLENWEAAEALIRSAASAGAHFIQTPEMSNALVRSREELMARITLPDHDPFLANSRGLASELGIYLHLGSLALLDGNGKVVNRGFIIGPDGAVLSFYDKIHMFDVDLPNGESWRESATYEPGKQSPVVALPFAKVGMAVCYDVRFPSIFREQAKLGAEILSAPAAFTRQTGQAHWHVLQRARAIENGAYVISAAQGGTHEDGRETYGHSLIVAPWGEVVGEIDGEEPGFVTADIDPENVAKARARIPAIANERTFESRLARALEETPA